jgi:hypothetical protein
MGAAMSKRGVIAIAVCYAVWIGALVAKGFPDPQCTDFYPLWIGSRALLAGTDPYSAEVCHTLRQSWSVAQTTNVAACVAYPLPWLLLISPLAMLPLSWAGPLWFGSSLALLLGGLWLLGDEVGDGVGKEALQLLPMLFYPVFHAVMIKTASVAVLGMVALMLWADRKEYRLLCGVLMAVSLCKPQVSLLFVAYILVRRFKRDRLTVLSFMVSGLVLLGLSLLLQPGWIRGWLAAVETWQREATIFSLLPEGAAVAALLFLRKAPALTRVALLQIVIFPANDLYSTLPLAVGWLTLGGWAPLVVSSCSWLAPLLFQHPNNLGTIWGFAVLPYLLSVLAATAPNQPFRYSSSSRASR